MPQMETPRGAANIAGLDQNTLYSSIIVFHKDISKAVFWRSKSPEGLTPSRWQDIECAWIGTPAHGCA
jgi:hypothetical protein